MIRLHVQGDLAPGAAVAPTLDQSRYLTQVMRLKAGDELLAREGEARFAERMGFINEQLQHYLEHGAMRPAAW